MPIINKQYTLNLPSGEGGDPSAIAVNDLIHIDRELSELYGKNIRQGQNFRVKGVQASLRGANSGYDVGMSAACRFSYAPTTKHTRKAWKSIFQDWYRQKSLRSGVGIDVRYDDMEFTYSTTYLSETGTSSLYQGGLGDADSDKMCIYGSSNESSNVFSLQDFYESMNPPALPSRYSVNNAPIKEAKFTDKFPDERSFWCHANASTVPAFEMDNITIPGFEDPMVSFTHLGGSDMSGPMETLPECANVFCGLLELDVWMIPDDTVAQVEDTAILYLTIWVESFSSILSYGSTGNSAKPRSYKSRKAFRNQRSRKSRR